MWIKLQQQMSRMYSFNHNSRVTLDDTFPFLTDHASVPVTMLYSSDPNKKLRIIVLYRDMFCMEIFVMDARKKIKEDNRRMKEILRGTTFAKTMTKGQLEAEWKKFAWDQVEFCGHDTENTNTGQ